MNKIICIIAVLFIFIGCLLPLGLYWSTFSGKLSHESKEWSNFGGYWAPFIAISNTLAIIFITAYFQKMEWAKNVILERPFIAIQRTKNADGYQLVNVGRGPAIQIITLVASSESFSRQAFNQNHICYSLRSGEDFSKPWLNGALIIVSYDDIFSNRYYSMMQRDRLHLFDDRYRALSKGVTDSATKENLKMYMEKFKRPERTWP
jgi:hypothetical protein